MHFTYTLHAGYGDRVRPWKRLQLAREPEGRGFADNRRPVHRSGGVALRQRQAKTFLSFIPNDVRLV